MRQPEILLRKLRRAWLPAALSLCWPVATVTAETAPIQQLHQVERAIDASRQRQQSLGEEAARLASEAAELKAKLIRAAAAAQDQETAVGKLEDRLSALIEQEKAKSAALEDRRAELAVTLSALARLSRTPPEAMIASPESAVDTMRSSQLLGQIVPALQQKAAALKADLTALADLRRSVADEQRRLADAIAGLDQERKTLNQLLQQKAQEQQRNLARRGAEGRRAERLAAEASDLKSLLEKLAAEERHHAAEAAAKARNEAEAKARAEADAQARAQTEQQAKAEAKQQRLAALPPDEITRGVAGLPARGRVIGLFGQPNDNGVIAKGITIETRPGAEVIAPVGGKIVFAGPFRGYGQLLIIAHPGGYHILLAGFARIDGTVGQSLSAGEPVGQMSSEDGHKPTLYVELRRNGEPINPIPWLAASERKVSG